MLDFDTKIVYAEPKEEFALDCPDGHLLSKIQVKLLTNHGYAKRIFENIFRQWIQKVKNMKGLARSLAMNLCAVHQSLLIFQCPQIAELDFYNLSITRITIAAILPSCTKETRKNGKLFNGK